MNLFWSLWLQNDCVSFLHLQNVATLINNNRMAGAEHTEYPADLDICYFTLNEYVPAKPLESNLEVVFTTNELVSKVIRYYSL